MNKRHLNNKELSGLVANICRDLSNSEWRPDYIVGLNRGGLVPATMISHYLGVPMHTLNVSLRDNRMGPESNLWMAEDAFGYVSKEERTDEDSVSDVHRRSNILIMDDINDTGATLKWIKEDWQGSAFKHDLKWETVWNDTVRFAVIVDNDASPVEVNYIGESINKAEDPQWIVFPWENWWKG